MSFDGKNFEASKDWLLQQSMLRKYVKKKAAAIRKRDRVIINGIFISMNNRTGKYKIQLVKPNFAELPTQTEKYDQFIEVDPKYIKRVKKVN